MTPCPCTSTLPYANCCAPFHQGQAAPSARQLMRSRYSAFVLGLGFAFITIPAQTTLQEQSPPSMRGKVFATQLTLGNVVSILPIAFVGGLADLFGIARVIVLVGLGVLAKGPPALIFFCGTWLVYQTWRGWRGVRARDHLAGVAVVLLMSLAWILPLIHKVGWELPLKVLQVEAVDRVAQAHRGNEGPLYFYPLSIALAAFPAVVMLPFIQARRLAAQQSAFVFRLCWVAVPVVLFSLSDAKESRYLLPL